MSGGREDRLVLGSDLAELDRLFTFIEGFCRAVGASDEIKQNFFLIAEELVVNVMNYGYGERADGKIDVILVRRDKAIELRIEDEAAPFDPFTEAAIPDVEAAMDDRPIGGLGVHLIKTLATHVDYRFAEGRNIVRATIDHAV